MCYSDSVLPVYRSPTVDYLTKVCEEVDAETWKLLHIVLERYYSNLNDLLIQVRWARSKGLDTRADVCCGLRVEGGGLPARTCFERLPGLAAKMRNVIGA